MAGRHNSRSTKEWVAYGLQRYVMCTNYWKRAAFSLDIFPYPGHITEFMRAHEVCEQVAKRFGGISCFAVRDYENSSMNLDFRLHISQFPVASFKKIQIAVAESQAKTRFMCAVCGAKARPSDRFTIDDEMVLVCNAHARAACIQELENPSTTIDEAAESLFLRIVRRNNDESQVPDEHASHQRERRSETNQKSSNHISVPAGNSLAGTEPRSGICETSTLAVTRLLACGHIKWHGRDSLHFSETLQISR